MRSPDPRSEKFFIFFPFQKQPETFGRFGLVLLHSLYKTYLTTR